MIADVYIDPVKRKNLLEANVKILEISPMPKLKKNGERYQKAFTPCRTLSLYDCHNLTNKWDNGKMRSAKVQYADGTIDDNVWICHDDIKE